MSMSIAVMDRWLARLTERDVVVYVKRLSANDTSRTGGHQAGTYLPKALTFRVVPGLDRRAELNPREPVAVRVVAPGNGRTDGNLIYYNNKRRTPEGTRDETRITGFGGEGSPLLDPENTGALVIFAFVRGSDGLTCEIWVCRNSTEEDRLECYIGEVEPGAAAIWEPRANVLEVLRKSAGTSCVLSPDQIPETWMTEFPTGAEIIAKTLELLPGKGLGPDDRLVRRRACEYEVFRSLEQVREMPAIREGFRTLDAFVDLAQTVLQRRKARSGRSFELHVKAVLEEEGFVEGRDFGYNIESEPRRRPDFLFPSTEAYRDPSFPADGLAMLGVKTTCKDRWRQILNEAKSDRIPTKHLITLQEGVTEKQHEEMARSGVRLVVPSSLHHAYPEVVRPRLMTLRDLLSHLRTVRCR